MPSLTDILTSHLESCYICVQTWYQVYEARDKGTGDGSILRYTVPTRKAADTLAVGLGVYGDPGRIQAVKYLAISLHPSSPSYDKNKPYYLVPADSPVSEADVERSMLRAQAVSKLTPAELASLIDPA